ncbi:PP2C-domain-containing protein [Basidiobolus meristosporus CBS 931.73]|uniref:protein-serine/threonine phosphatase n=1 Tax=Basidiobolus meristosporus CBS 931.73 TaxID=1314790 RepID=A0A1Y1Y4P4_9FUNG|nr:PP2C-domain-containing protein [Basidiobolus meristosporus CBS 931.73]|eukprot:ORX92875.1 PP2C-domain-containing protein [Basidiobolus meristosporus CBS 931.73]
MGQTLSEPVVEKHSTFYGDERLICGASAMQGWRVTMEDAHTTILKLKDLNDTSFFGVYDGHGGRGAAKYSGEQLHQRIIKDEAFLQGDYALAIKNGFLGADSDLKRDSDFIHDSSGCTAVTALITPDKRIFVGNAGDSRAVLSAGGKAKAMSEDHKPVNEGESSRIVAAGGFVEFGRVNGNLALSRAIGDFEFKQNLKLNPEDQIVTANPDVAEHTLATEDEFLVLACDGIWDCMSSEEVVAFVRAKIAEHQTLAQICESMMDHCLAPDSELGGIGCDNMTVVIVGFLQGRTEEEWYQWISKRVQEDASGLATSAEQTLPLQES